MTGPAMIAAEGSRKYRSASRGTGKPLEEPMSKRGMTTREKIILLKSSKLHGSIFPPWDSAPEPSEFECPVGDAQFL